MNNDATENSTHLNRLFQHVQHHGQGPIDHTLIHLHLASARCLWRTQVNGEPLSKRTKHHLECMLGIQDVIAPEIHSVSLCHHDDEPHIMEHRGKGGRSMEKYYGLGDQKVHYIL